MSYDIEKALAYQVKKEIAQRYFRLRKLIEDDSANLNRLLDELNGIYVNKIRPALFAIYSLLMDKDLIEEFSKTVGIEEPPFLSEFLELSEKERAALVSDLHPHGWFKESRFLSLLKNAYEKLYERWLEYHDLREETLDELALVREEIEQFKKNYSLDEIMQFLRTLNMEDTDTAKAIGRTVEGRKLGDFDTKLGFSQDIEGLSKKVPRLDSIPKPEVILPKLEALGEMAYMRHKDKVSEILPK